jgi:hypothetical protein
MSKRPTAQCAMHEALRAVTRALAGLSKNNPTTWSFAYYRTDTKYYQGGASALLEGDPPPPSGMNDTSQALSHGHGHCAVSGPQPCSANNRSAAHEGRVRQSLHTRRTPFYTDSAHVRIDRNPTYQK